MHGLFRDEADDSENDDDDYLISRHEWICGDTCIVYHLSFLAPGHGDALWNSSRCIAQHLLQDNLRERLLFTEDYSNGIISTPPESTADCNRIINFVWPPSSALEFGVGAALPSLALIKLGVPKVVLTDRKVNESTFEALERSISVNCSAWNTNQANNNNKQQSIVVAPHTWGVDIPDLQEHAQQERFDLLIASDCIYNPQYHQALLESVYALLDKHRGRLIVGYSFHGNVPNPSVLDFFQKADVGGLQIVKEFSQSYDQGQEGIGGVDPERGAVHIKVLAYR